MKFYWFKLKWEGDQVIRAELAGNSPYNWPRGKMTFNRSHIIARDELDAFMLAQKG